VTHKHMDLHLLALLINLLLPADKLLLQLVVILDMLAVKP
jgi:hypothetical protein